MINQLDFLVFDKNTISDVIQVTFDMGDENTKKREIKGLIEACKNFDLKSGTIITFDSEDELIENGIKIKIIPFYKWSII